MTVQQLLPKTDLMDTALPTSLATGSTRVTAAADNANSAKVADAAQQFEAMMLNELLKPLQFGASVDEGGEEGSGGAAGTIRGLATDALGKALAEHGGVGVARKVEQEMTKVRHTTKVKNEETKVQ
jgi:Rod binding domain-containing protein